MSIFSYRAGSFLTTFHSSHSLGADDSESYSHEQLRNLLQFADKYRCPATRLFAIDHIWDARYSYRPSELIQISFQFHVPKFFKRGFRSLLDMPLKAITKDLRLEMGNDAFVALVYAKSVLDEHTRIIASEEPVVLAHANDCQDAITCQEDWHNVWWNGMGRFLLDGRNPQPFSDAVKHFRKMQFGRMGNGCQKLMFDVLERGVGFQHANVFIADICDGFVKQFGLTEPM